MTNTQTDSDDELRKQVADTFGLQTSPDGEPEHLLEYDVRGNCTGGSDFSGEVTVMVQLIQAREREARIDEWQSIINQKQKPMHGNCCTCQNCGYAHDECICELVRKADDRLQQLQPKPQAGDGREK